MSESKRIWQRLHYNSPVVLTFTLLALAIHVISATITKGLTSQLFSLGASFQFSDPLEYLRIFLHALGHGSYAHLFSNLTFILLLGPILEEKYGSSRLLTMMLITAFVTGVAHLIVSTNSSVLGASGIVFMYIVLVSIVDTQAGRLPLTFVLVVMLFLGRELVDAFKDDQISQLVHIVGGLVGAFFGFALMPRRSKPVD